MDKNYTIGEALKELNDMDGADSLFEMATVGYFSEKSGEGSGSLIKVMITSDGGRPQAHVHITRKKGNHIYTCIKLDKAEYFLHDKYKDKLTKDQVESLMKFFNSPSDQPVYRFMGKDYKLKTQWDFTVIQWNVENQLYKKVWLPVGIDNEGYIISPQIPDYSTLETVG